MNTLVKIIIGDITKLKVECIVNGTLQKMVEGGSVHAAILKAAGPRLKLELEKFGKKRVGESKLTDGYELPSKKIIHTVLPTWINGESNEEEELAVCYKNTLDLAIKNRIKVLAFPVLGTGAFRFPKDLSVKCALTSIRRLTKLLKSIEEINLVAFDKETFNIFKEYF
jgi:O-acetyl-ADP-ribose deacetylase (regulator of RNase III)